MIGLKLPPPVLKYVNICVKNRKEPKRTGHYTYRGALPTCTPCEKQVQDSGQTHRPAPADRGIDRQIWWKTAKQQNKFGGKRQNGKINLVGKKKKPTFTSKFKDYGKGYNMLQEKDV